VDGLDQSGELQLVEHDLHGAAEVVGLAGDLGGVGTSWVGEQPGDDFSPGLATEEAAELEEEGGRLIAAGRLAQAAMFNRRAEESYFLDGSIRAG
jgi:hypothetical protein